MIVKLKKNREKLGKTGQTGTKRGSEKSKVPKTDHKVEIKEEATKIEYQDIPRDKSLIHYREFPNVAEFKEQGLVLYSKGYKRTKIGVVLGKTRNWFNYHYENDIYFKRYVQKIDEEIARRIQENAINLADKMNDVLDTIADEWKAYPEPKERLQVGKLALDYLTRTGRLPKSVDKEKEEKRREELQKKISDLLAENYGEDFRF